MTVSSASGAVEPTDPKPPVPTQAAPPVTKPIPPETVPAPRKDPEAIREEIEATKDRISDSVEALAEIKADIDYAKSHPKEVVKEKVAGAKDDIVSRVVEKKDELMARRKASAGSSKGSGINDIVAKAKEVLNRVYRIIETKLDELLGVESDSHRR